MGSRTPFGKPGMVYSMSLMLFGVETLWNMALVLGRWLFTLALMGGRTIARVGGFILFGVTSARRRMTNVRRRRRRQWHEGSKY